jgi:hypothetical protein
LVDETERLRAKYIPRYAAQFLGEVRPETLTPFEDRDPLNPQNIVSGYLCHQADHRYGALVILQVNGNDAEQVIYATPKLHYPFAHDIQQNTRKYHWPMCKSASLFTKWDGTNVLYYSYANHRGERFATAKVRLGPFLRNGKFGAFLDMWKEMVQQTGFIVPPEVLSGDIALSFEMYGYRNLITVKYPFPLKITLLFGVRQKDATPLIPTECPESLAAFRNPLEAEIDTTAWVRAVETWNRLIRHCSSPADYAEQCEQTLTAFYEKAREEAGKNCRESKTDEGKLEGTEGHVLYLYTEDPRYVTSPRWTLWKIKPEIVEQIHWATDRPSYRTILPTAWNALETLEPENLTYSVMKQLLLEEFAEDKIEEAKPLIEKAIVEVQSVLAFRTAVKTTFEAAPDKSNRQTLMRYMASVLDELTPHMKRLYARTPRGKWMQILFGALLQQGLVREDLPKTAIVL